MLASYLERESKVESGREEEKAVGVVEGCLCSTNSVLCRADQKL